MRFGCLFGGMFWGVVLVVLGGVLLLNIIFHISIPIFSILFALVFIYLGVRLIIGWRRWPGTGAWFGRRHVDVGPAGDRHDVLFGSAHVDLTRVALGSETVRAEVNTVFGSSRVRINPSVPMKITISAAFSSVRLPDGSNTVLGEHTWRTRGLDEGKPYLALHIATVFGETRVSEG